MCDVSNYIETIKCKDGDCLIFAIDIDIWDNEDVCKMIGDVQKKMPEVKMAVVPSDLIDHIIHIDKSLPVINQPITFAPGISVTDYTTPINTCYSDEDLNNGWGGLE